MSKFQYIYPTKYWMKNLKADLEQSEKQEKTMPLKGSNKRHRSIQSMGTVCGINALRLTTVITKQWNKRRALCNKQNSTHKMKVWIVCQEDERKFFRDCQWAATVLLRLRFSYVDVSVYSRSFENFLKGVFLVEAETKLKGFKRKSATKAVSICYTLTVKWAQQWSQHISLKYINTS